MKGFLWIGAAAFVVGASAASCGGGVQTETTGAGGSGAGGSATSSTTSATVGAGGGSASSSVGSGGAGNGGAGNGGGSAASTSGAGGGGMVGCNPACGLGLVCCNGICVNQGNDIKNCGGCGNVCSGGFPFCDNGVCGKPPCDPGTSCNGGMGCCGNQCCMTGMICCVVPAGPVGPPMCAKPNTNGTCEPGCPGCVCASPDTPIATPDGERAIADLAEGDLVYSVNAGDVVAVPIVKVNRAQVSGHRVVRALLASGRAIEISPRHPTGDGRTFGDLRPGDTLHGALVIDVSLIPYGHDFTYDVLPASDTGTYFAGGALIGSTLATQPALPPEASYALP